jgi:colicin import membrane protein
MAEKVDMAALKPLISKYKKQLKDAFPEVVDSDWEEKFPLLIKQSDAIALGKAELKGEDVESKKAEIVAKYRLIVDKELGGKAAKAAAAAAKKDEGAALRAAEKAAADAARARVRAELKPAAAAAAVAKITKTSAERRDAIRQAFEKKQREAQEAFNKQMKALEEKKGVKGVREEAEKLARANSAELKRLALGFEAAAEKNIKEVLAVEKKQMYAWHKEGLAKARAAGNSGRNATLKNIGAKNFLNKCSFCKYCRRTRRGNGKSAAGAKSAVTSAAGRSPGRNSGNAAGAADNAGAAAEGNDSQNI